MSDVFDDYVNDPTSVPPLTRAVIAGMPTTITGVTVGPVANDSALRALLDGLADLETRVTTLESA